MSLTADGGIDKLTAALASEDLLLLRFDEVGGEGIEREALVVIGVRGAADDDVAARTAAIVRIGLSRLERRATRVLLVDPWDATVVRDVTQASLAVLS